MTLTPLKQRIYDAVRRGGADGVDLQVIMGAGYSRDTIKAHVWQINQVLVGERIVGTRGGVPDSIYGWWPYRLVKVAKSR